MVEYWIEKTQTLLGTEPLFIHSNTEQPGADLE